MRLAGRVSEPDARGAAVLLQGKLRDGVCHPLPVGRELRVAHYGQRQIGLDGDGTLLSESDRRDEGRAEGQTSPPKQRPFRHNAASSIVPSPFMRSPA